MRAAGRSLNPPSLCVLPSRCARPFAKPLKSFLCSAQIVGNCVFRAPVPATGMYDPSLYDVWQMGVILFFLVGIDLLPDHEDGNPLNLFGPATLEGGGANPYHVYGRGRLQEDGGELDGDGVPRNTALWDSFPALKARVSPNLRQLLNGMLCIPEHLRLTAERVLHHPWLAESGEPMPAAEREGLLAERYSTAHKVLRLNVAGLAPTRDAVLEAMADVIAAIPGFARPKARGWWSPVKRAVHSLPCTPVVVLPKEHRIQIGSPAKYVAFVDEHRHCFVQWECDDTSAWMHFRIRLERGVQHRMTKAPLDANERDASPASKRRRTTEAEEDAGAGAGAGSATVAPV